MKENAARIGRGQAVIIIIVPLRWNIRIIYLCAPWPDRWRLNEPCWSRRLRGMAQVTRAIIPCSGMLHCTLRYIRGTALFSPHNHSRSLRVEYERQRLQKGMNYSSRVRVIVCMMDMKASDSESPSSCTCSQQRRLNIPRNK